MPLVHFSNPLAMPFLGWRAPWHGNAIKPENHDREKPIPEPTSRSILQTERGHWYEQRSVLIAAVIGALGTISGAIVTIVPDLFSKDAASKPSGDYFLNYSFYHVDLEGFAPLSDENIGSNKSIVDVARIDSIVKNTKADTPYRLPFYTTGHRISVETLKSTIIPQFDEVESPDEQYRHSYEYILDLGDKPLGHIEVAHTLFRFIDGFRNNQGEWWFASVKYPTRSISVHIQCPSRKRCKSVRVFRRIGYGSNVEIVDNPPFLSRDGRHILWMGNDEKPETRILFNWTW